MTARYLIVVGCDEPHRRAVAARIARAANMATISLGVTATLVSNRWLTIAPDGPCIVGQIFKGVTAIGGNEDLVYSEVAKPESLISHYWGRYIAIWSQSPDKLLILRDPSAAVPCYYQSSQGLVLVSSDLDLLELASSVPTRLDWPEIARILGAGDLRGPSTAIEGLLELPPGCLLEIEDGRLEPFELWNPWHHVRSDERTRFDDLANTLRARVDMVVKALATDRPSAMATVSGGLDSSIVALALSTVVPSLTCLTLATTEPSGDERRYARLVADAAAANYRECFLDSAHVDLHRSQVAHLPRPVGRAFFQSVTAIVSDTARSNGSLAVFSGTGGDNVFCSLQSATPVADLLLEGKLRDAARSVGDIAALTGGSYTEVALAALRRWSASGRPYRWREDRRFLSDTQKAAASHFEHPWLLAPDGALPGQIAHIAMLLRVQNYLEPWPLDGMIESVDPLLAQPIVEHCLTIPSWQWCRGGVDRALARRAFAERLPEPVQRRRWKGGPEGFIGKLVEDNRSLIRSALLDGSLADQHLLDRDAIAAILDNPRQLSSGDALRLLALTDAEAWVRLRC